MPCQCLPVASSWVTFACVVDGKLTLVFKDGDAVEYPGLGESDLSLLVLSGSPGRYVNTVLKGQPYTIVAAPTNLLGNPPVLKGDCLVCRTLHAQVSFEYSVTDVLGPFALRVTYDEVLDLWRGSFTCNGDTYTLDVWYDAVTGWRWQMTGVAETNLPMLSCDPWDIDGEVSVDYGYCGHASEPVQVALVMTE